MSEFKFSCPHCEQHIQCDSKFSGRQIQCPGCNHLIVIPPSPTVVEQGNYQAQSGLTWATHVPPPADRAREEKRAAAVLSPHEGWFLCYYLAECSHAAQIFLVVLVLVLVLDWVSGLDYEDDSVAAAPLRALS